MTSDRQIAANRRNARRSTGPRSRAGKAQSSRNSLRHGLTAAVSADPVLAKEAESLAAAIAGAAAEDPIVLARARAVAEAELALVRVRLVRARLLDYPTAKGMVYVKKFARMLRSRALTRRFGQMDKTGEDIGDIIAETFYDMYGFPETPAEKEADAFEHMASEFAKIDRYERRAFSRRRAAIRALDDALAERGRRAETAPIE